MKKLSQVMALTYLPGASPQHLNAPNPALASLIEPRIRILGQSCWRALSSVSQSHFERMRYARLGRQRHLTLNFDRLLYRFKLAEISKAFNLRRRYPNAVGKQELARL